MAMHRWRCHLCNESIASGPARACHMRNVWKTSNDPSRCDNIARNEQQVQQVPQLVPLVATAVLATVARESPLTRLARRRPMLWEEEREMRQAYIIADAGGDEVLNARNMNGQQDAWDAFLFNTRSLCSDDFWHIFLNLHTCSTTAIDSALNSVKKVFVHGQESQAMFPISKRVLLNKMSKTFWPHVSHTYEINLSAFELPSKTSSIVFKFVDPVWAWIMAARKQHPAEMHWRPVSQTSGRAMYGGGIQFGEFFRQACESVPAGCYPMCVGLHWDGTSSHGLSSSPICVCVGNTNSCDRSAQFCVGYMSHVSDEKQPEYRKTQRCTNVKFYIRQQCAKIILRVLEEAAKRGVKCRLVNTQNKEVQRVLFPRLSSMNFDQPEAQIFFGLQNKTSCTKCRQVFYYIMIVHDITENATLNTPHALQTP